MPVDGSKIGATDGVLFTQALDALFVSQVRLANAALQTPKGFQFTCDGRSYFHAKDGNVYRRMLKEEVS